jgi:hypothetical protein
MKFQFKRQENDVCIMYDVSLTMSGLNGVTALGQLCFVSSEVLQVYGKSGYASSHDLYNPAEQDFISASFPILSLHDLNDQQDTLCNT